VNLRLHRRQRTVCVSQSSDDTELHGFRYCGRFRPIPIASTMHVAGVLEVRFNSRALAPFLIAVGLRSCAVLYLNE